MQGKPGKSGNQGRFNIHEPTKAAEFLIHDIQWILSALGRGAQLNAFLYQAKLEVFSRSPKQVSQPSISHCVFHSNAVFLITDVVDVIHIWWIISMECMILSTRVASFHFEACQSFRNESIPRAPRHQSWVDGNRWKRLGGYVDVWSFQGKFPLWSPRLKKHGGK